MVDLQKLLRSYNRVKSYKRNFGSTERKQLDEIEKVFTDVGIAPSKEQKEAFKRSTSMKVAEGVGSFIPELVKFAAINAVTGGVLGTTGYGARLAALGRSKIYLIECYS